jgi:hypothetical protein
MESAPSFSIDAWTGRVSVPREGLSKGVFLGSDVKMRFA